MLVQLRRVVYLLVLLQFCSGVCFATTQEQSQAESVKQEGSEKNEEKVAVVYCGADFEDMEIVSVLEPRLKKREEFLGWALERWYGLFLQARVCLDIWKREVKKCDDGKKEVENAVAASDILAREIEAEANKEGNVLLGDGDSRMAELKKLFNNANESMKKANDTIEKRDWAAADLRQMKEHCKLPRGNIRNAIEDVSAKLCNYNVTAAQLKVNLEEMPITSPYKNATKTLKEMELLEEEYKNHTADDNIARWNAGVQMEDVKKAIKNVSNELVKLKEKLNSINETRTGRESEDTEKLQQSMVEITKVIEAAKYFPRNVVIKNLSKGSAVRQEIEEKEVVERQKKEKEKQDEIQRLADEAARKAQEEKERLAREQRERESAEQAEREREAKEKEEKARKEEEEKVRKAVEEERKKKAHEEKEARARAVAEEAEAKRAAEEEAERKAKEEMEKQKRARENKDSVSPALLHSPLLLLLLCVLGSILVC